MYVFEGGCCEMNFLLWRVRYCMSDGVVIRAGVRMLRDELPAAESRVLSDGVASAAGVRMLADELPVVEARMLSDGVAGVGGRMP